MNPGRELDALIAEKVFGASPPREKNAIGEAGYWTHGGKTFVHIRPYSTDIAAAWELVEKLHATGMGRCFALSSHRYGDGLLFEASFEPSQPNERYSALTAPHAICLAALKAVGHEFLP